MDLHLDGTRALVSGGHKGLGRAITRRLLEEGASVAICCRRRDELDEAVATLGELGTVVGHICDFSDVDAVQAWVRDAAEALGGIDICVGNASASGQRGDGPEPWKNSFAVDILGTAMFYEAAHPFLAESDAAAIVQIATITAIEHHDVPISPSYGASKAAGINLIAQLAQRWGAEGIRANTVSPGPILIENGRWDDIRERLPELYERDRLMHPLERMGTDDEVADVVAFLASSRASWVNGANVVVDGGYTKQVGF
ncbi:SDR family NAD(P)-dependent oxidoreductase [Ilumatobacter coccineus]|uniref:Putative oxidoreductase n=1 Tax=Ilumatobacter coccineus (strain NBRC 103263 / KCTC 29153 / YM16-304) TaxID=1313172 RepID=A0A6C7EHI5_ILUCY|nr:SDR family oxidoreductase [Ilumatobacter coccineus]BAN04435.1 putative oxidoreductase [Ilumatobacter coccineus YM16-304]